MLRDFRFGVRLLAKSPVFAVTAALLLAVGISANTLIFSLVNTLLLRPLPVLHPENLVRMVEVYSNDFVTWDFPHNFCDAAASMRTGLAEVICQGEADVALKLDLGSGQGPSIERIRVHLVSPNFFSSLGVHAYVGRLLTAEDERSRAMNAVLSYDFWQRKMRGDPAILGRRITLGEHPFTIVGVSAEGFNGLTVDTSPDLRVPAAVDRLLTKADGEISPNARPLFSQVFGRLRTGASFERASAEADPLLHAAYDEELDKVFPGSKAAAAGDSTTRSRLRLESIANGVSTLRAQFSRSLEVLMAGVALLLLMACANIAGLLLARSAGRSHEMSIRLALGASRGRIVRQLLTEGLLLSLLGGVAGVLLTKACLPLLARGIPPIRDRSAILQPLAVHIPIDLRVLGFAVGITVLTAILFALSPALRSSRADVISTLRAGRTATGRLTARNLVVVGQVAICTVILIGAALLVETLQRMRSMNPGFDRDRVVTFTIDPALRGYTPQQTRALSRSLLNKAGVLPGVSGVTIAARGLMRGTGMKSTFGAAGTRLNPTEFLSSSLHDVTPGYFETMGMHLLGGRAFTWFDRNSGTLVSGTPIKAIVNQAFARRFFPGKNPVGERFGSPGPGGITTATREVIGIVSDAKYRSLREPIPPTVYHPVVDGFSSAFVLHVRTQQPPETMIAPVRQVLRSLDPELPPIEVRTLRQEVEASLWQERLLASLSTIFGAIAALLASIGLYGALDYSVKSRTREIGVRMALGAQPAGVVGLFSREVLLLTVSGVALGLCAYAGATVWIRRVLYELHPWEPVPVLLVLSFVGLIAAIAAAPAVLRAVRIDPASALRAE